MEKNSRRFNLDLNSFTKVEDILFIDEPILSHYTRNNKNYFLYLIDTLDDFDRYLLLEVTEELIFKYLTSRLSLFDVITKNRNISFMIDQDFDGNVIDGFITECESLNENYLPMEDSFLEYEPTQDSYYFELIKKYESNLYLENLRSNAFYVKLSPKNEKYADTIGLNELTSKFLNGLSSSFKSFLKADFISHFKNDRTDLNKLNTTFNRLLPDLDFRTVDFRYGSFEVGLAVDKIMKGGIEDEEIKSWSIDVGYKYKDLVLNDDNYEHNVEYIMDTYESQDRRKIFNPIFKIIESSNYSLKVRDYNQEKYRKIRIKNKSVISRIVPEKTKTDKSEPEKDYAIVQVTTVVDKNKFKKTVSLENTLFNSTDETEILLRNNNFEKFGYNLDFDISVPVKISTNLNTVSLSTMYDGLPFEVEYHSDKIDEGIDKITNKIYEYILNKDKQ